MTGLTRSDLFGVELHHEPQHTVRRRVLRTHVDDHRVVELVLRPHAAAGEHDLLRARPRLQLLRALRVWRSSRSSSSCSSSLRISVIAIIGLIWGAGRP